MVKDDGAFLTIGELARDLGVAQHILRYWESRFPQLRPLQRSGNRRYYRPADVELARRINRLLNEEGFTVKGAQRALGEPNFSAEQSGSVDGVIETTFSSPLEPESGAGGRAAAPQGMLPMGDLTARAGEDQSRKSAGVPSTDLAVLIARLTVIRESLQQAIDPK